MRGDLGLKVFGLHLDGRPRGDCRVHFKDGSFTFEGVSSVAVEFVFAADCAEEVLKVRLMEWLVEHDGQIIGHQRGGLSHIDDSIFRWSGHG